ncbi:ATP-binding cassette domain-containing protein, partial [Salmonella enterica subsp. enterica serovar Virginia]|nr:ATP-binding cassette domain-containing protein [Salmonella enterica subsp. enterica serovar Virginia]
MFSVTFSFFKPLIAFVNSGEIVGLLGPNGAGKTTTFYMVVGIVPRDAGNIIIDDEDI